jgi:hypothetical protein
MIRLGFLDSESRRDLIDLARDGSVAHRLARRANALVLLDKGMSCQSVADSLPLRRQGYCCPTATQSGAGTNSISKTGSKAWRASAMKGAAAG